MAEQEKVQTRKITLKNTAERGSRFVHDSSGRQVLLGPGQEQEVEVSEAVAKHLEESSKGGSDLHASGFEPEEQQRPEDAPEIPEEQESRGSLAKAEKELMEEGQEQDKERRERDEKKKGEVLAAETGIHMHARGLKPEVVASPPDLEPKKRQQTSAQNLSGRRTE